MTQPDYSRFGINLLKQDTRRDINPALQSVEDELDAIVHTNSDTTKFYLDALYGNDSNDGTSSATKIQTAERLVALLNGFWFGQVVVFISGGTYNLDPLTDQLAFAAATNRASLHFLGQDKTIIASGTVQVGSTSTVVQVSSIGASDRSGYSFEFTSGALQNFRRTIRDSTSSTVTFGEPLTSTPVAGDTFQVFEPAAVFKRNTTLATVSALIALPLGLSGPHPASGELARGQTSCFSISNILFENVSASASGTRLLFLSNTALFGVMSRNFSLVCVNGGGAAGDSNWFSMKTLATTVGPSSLSALSEALGFGTSGLISQWDSYGFGTDPALSCIFGIQNGVFRLRGCVSSTWSALDRAWIWSTGGRSRTYYDLAYNSYAYIDRMKIGNGAGFGLTVISHSMAEVISSCEISAIRAVETYDGTTARIASNATITGSTHSLSARRGTITFTSAAILSGDTRIGDTGATTVLNMKTGAAVSNTQTVAAYAAVGDSFSSGFATIAMV